VLTPTLQRSLIELHLHWRLGACVFIIQEHYPGLQNTGTVSLGSYRLLDSESLPFVFSLLLPVLLDHIIGSLGFHGRKHPSTGC
jgi:hypothetical protein